VWERGMARYVIFGAIGPFLGGLILLVVGTPTGYWDNPYSDDLAKLLRILFSTLQYNYLFGIIPALMTGAVDDILAHVHKISPAIRMFLTGAFAFAAAALIYGSTQSETGLAHYATFGLVGLIPAMISSWLAHRAMERRGAQTA
jgi:hypothetical protein